MNASFKVCFESLFQPGRSLLFPCDARGNVPMDTLPQQARDNYLFARATIGRNFAVPRILTAGKGAA